VVDKYKIEEVLIALEYAEQEEIWKIINKLQDKYVIIKVIPDMYNILTGSVKMSAIYGTPLIQISYDIMPIWQKNLKRIIDVVASFIAIIILIPVYITLAIVVKLSSKGPILYSHERIGRYGKPFTIYKFRSMLTDAEKHGPALSSKSDSRITPFGKIMRKSRFDEVPQFFNVLFGDMSLVGPRPERQFFIDQIIQTAPHYLHLHKVRPGITSWGQVKYGYAENVDQMIERLKYDIIYLENMSLYLDFKIMIYTVKTLLQRSGK
jgi:exopolysaccharide biosynthesis polyprenyl glycosylphosphotransferase